MSSLTSDQGPISSISESATDEGYLLHALASTLFCENYLYLGRLAHLCANRGAREFRLCQCLPPSRMAAWLIFNCARRTSTFLACAFREQEDDQAALPLAHLSQFRKIMREGLHTA